MTNGRLLERLSRDGPWLSVGIMTANLLELGSELRVLEESGVGLVHIDVMDGVFCPQITVGPPIVRALRTFLVRDVHLMIEDPLTKIEPFVDAGAEMITFHLAGASQPHRVLQALALAASAAGPDRDLVRGVALNPSTPVQALEPLLADLEYVLVLGINPGWSGQSFLPDTGRRLERVRRLVDDSGRHILVGVDGGVTRDNIGAVAGLGADIIVSGSAIFDGGDVRANIATMTAAIRSASRRSTADAAASPERP